MSWSGLVVLLLIVWVAIDFRPVASKYAALRELEKAELAGVRTRCGAIGYYKMTEQMT